MISLSSASSVVKFLKSLRRKEENMRKGTLSFMLFLVLIAAGICAPSATVAAYPEKAVTFFCGFPAGGAMDMTARALTEAARKYFPKPMAVVNRPGAAGTIGAAEIVQAKPDGYTIGITAVAVLTVQPHRTKLPFGSPEDYTPIIKLVNNPICLTVKSDSPWKTIQEFIAYARANPGKVRVGHPGIGTIPHLNAEQLKVMANIDLTAVPFAGGAESVPAMLGGHVEAISQHHSEVLPQVQAGKARVLAICEEKRNPLFPDAPTFKEIGYDITSAVYYLVIGPKGLPSQIITKLHDSLKKAMEDPIFVKPMEGKGFYVSYEGPQDLKRRLMRDYEINAKFVDLLKLKKE
jgi:tripartite-type tricarboxylate transporter receptor subunit TctC